jgi:ribonuclease HI
MDAAFWEPLGTGAWGFIARDDRDEFVTATGKLRQLRSALHAETSWVTAVEGAVALGLNMVVFESDSKVLVGALNSSSPELSEISILLHEARSMCISSFESFSFVCCRICNKIAQTLAKFGSQTEEDCIGWG